MSDVKTVRFTHFVNKRYTCAEDGDQSGEWVPLEQFNRLVAMCRKLVAENVDTPGDVIREAQAILDALPAAPDAEVGSVAEAKQEQ